MLSKFTRSLVQHRLVDARRRPSLEVQGSEVPRALESPRKESRTAELPRKKSRTLPSPPVPQSHKHKHGRRGFEYEQVWWVGSSPPAASRKLFQVPSSRRLEVPSSRKRVEVPCSRKRRVEVPRSARSEAPRNEARNEARIDGKFRIAASFPPAATSSGTKYGRFVLSHKCISASFPFPVEIITYTIYLSQFFFPLEWDYFKPNIYYYLPTNIYNVFSIGMEICFFASKTKRDFVHFFGTNKNSVCFMMSSECFFLNCGYASIFLNL